MFEKLKKKLKKVVEHIVKKEEAPVEVGETLEPSPETKPEALPPEPEITPIPEAPPPEPEITPTPEAPRPEILPPTKPRVLKRVVKRITGRGLSPKDVEDVIWELQVGLLESDVAVSVTDQVIERVRADLTGRKLGLRGDPKKLANDVLRQAIHGNLVPEQKVDLLKVIEEKRARGEPAVIVFLGINGHGKCVSGDTLIPLADGRVLQIGKIYGEMAKSREEKAVEGGFVIDEGIPDSLQVLTVNPGTLRVEAAKPSALWKLRADRLLQVGLKNGASVGVFSFLLNHFWFNS